MAASLAGARSWSQNSTGEPLESGERGEFDLAAALVPADSALSEAVLVDGSGAPITLNAGGITRLDDATGAVQNFFTSRDASFTLMDLRPGRYRLELDARSVLLEIPDGEAGMVELGALVAANDG